MTIYKYPIYTPSTLVEVEMPKDAVILSCGLDSCGIMCVWAMVDPDVGLELRKIYCIGTGWNVDEMADEVTQFVGTVKDGDFIWHIFTS